MRQRNSMAALTSASLTVEGSGGKVGAVTLDGSPSRAPCSSNAESVDALPDGAL